MICKHLKISEKDFPKCELQSGYCLLVSSQDLCPSNPNNKLGEYKREASEKKRK